MTITEEEWIRQFKPIYLNNSLVQLNDKDIENHPINNIWTEIEGDFENVYIVPGIKLLNNLNFYLTEIPYSNTNILVDLNEKCDKIQAKEATVEYLISKHQNVKIAEIRAIFKDVKDMNVNKAKYITLDYLLEYYPEESEEFWDDIHDFFNNYF